MKIAHLIRRDFQTVNPYSGINAIKNELKEYTAIVVEEEGHFYGVLTINDLVQNPRTLIIDCLTIKELIDSNHSVEQTILKMDIAKIDVLPVGENGKFIGLVFRDELYKYISEYNLELKKNVKQRTQELKKAIATKDLIFSIILHDLKVPFVSILGFTGLLKKHIQNQDIDKAEKLISNMNSQARNTYNLLENLLSWARYNTNKIGFHPTYCNISLICDEVIEQLKETTQMKGITINSFHQTEAYADKSMLEIIFRNLISNAIKFTESQGNIEIYSMVMGEFIEITVSDTGIGIEEKDKTILFKSDFNESKFGTENEKGAGLGLVICKGFVERHHGKIWIEDNPNKGSMFKFTLPIYKEQEHGVRNKILHQKT